MDYGIPFKYELVLVLFKLANIVDLRKWQISLIDSISLSIHISTFSFSVEFQCVFLNLGKLYICYG